VHEAGDDARLAEFVTLENLGPAVIRTPALAFELAI
jgi:hypothetical protein